MSAPARKPVPDSFRRKPFSARGFGVVLLALAAITAVAAPALAPHDPALQHSSFLHAPPMRPHVIGKDGRLHAPFFHPLRLASRLESRYEEDLSREVPIWTMTKSESPKVRPSTGSGRGELGEPRESESHDDTPWFPLGADSYGRDILSRLLYGARVSLGVALVAVLGSLAVGALVGGAAGYFGGLLDETLMRLAEFIVVLPTVYLVLALRAALPLVLAPAQVFALMAAIFTLVGWPFVARGVRGIVAVERQRDYAEAARAAGAGHARILFRHLLPATAGHLGTQATLLVPAFILAEATLSFVGLGFPDPTPTWGTMLQEASNVTTLSQFPWTLAPAGAVFVVVLGVNLIVGKRPVIAWH